MILAIECSEATIYKNDDNKLGKSLGFVSGAIIKDPDGNTLCSVSGSEEYGFQIEGVLSYEVAPKTRHSLRRVMVVVNWKKSE